MNIASMFLRILAILGAIGAAVMFWMIGDTKDKLTTELQNTETQLTSTTGQLDTLRGEHEELQGTAEELTTTLNETQARATNLDTQLAQVRKELVEANQTITARNEEKAQLESDAARIRRELLEERTRVGELEKNLDGEDAAALRQSIEMREEQLAIMEKKIQDLTAAGANVDDIDSEGEVKPAVVLRGEVVEVGEGSAFVVINLGSTAGARPDSSVMIRRGPRYIGRALIREVKNNASVAEVSPGAGNIRPGDSAVTLN